MVSTPSAVLAESIPPTPHLPPYDSSTCSVWRVIANEDEFSLPLIVQLDF